MFKEELVLVCQQKAQERKANEYIEKNKKKRKQMKRKKVVIGTLIATFFLVGCKIVGDNDLESMGIVVAQETESETSYENTETIGGTVFHKHVIVCDDDYWRKYENNVYEGGTRVVVEYNGNGTEDPGDDIVKSVERER